MILMSLPFIFFLEQYDLDPYKLIFETKSTISYFDKLNQKYQKNRIASEHHKRFINLLLYAIKYNGNFFNILED